MKSLITTCFVFFCLCAVSFAQDTSQDSWRDLTNPANDDKVYTGDKVRIGVPTSDGTDHKLSVRNVAPNASAVYIFQEQDPNQTPNSALNVVSDTYGFHLNGKGTNSQFYLMHLRNDGASRMIVKRNGNVGIGTASPSYKLDVCGNMRAKEIKVEEGWCDYVFEADYSLPTLEQEDQFIQENGHLSGFQSEEEMAGHIDLGDVTARQQAKIEEMMLHLIELDKTVKSLQEENVRLKEQVAAGK